MEGKNIFFVVLVFLAFIAPVGAATTDICDSGDKTSVCEVGSTYDVTDTEITGSGDLVINSSGTLQTDSGINTSSLLEFDTIKVEGEIRGNVNLTGNTVNITETGLLDASQKGYRYEQGPGAGSRYKSEKGWASGAGFGDYGGDGSSSSGGSRYGSVENPTSLGSGGGGQNKQWKSFYQGGDGGGRIMIDVSEVIANGQIKSNGGDGQQTSNRGAGGGSGGSILIQSDSFTGTGTVEASGGGGSNSAGGAGGRIAVYTNGPDFSGVIKTASQGGYTEGGRGTVYFQDTSTGDEIRSGMGRLEALSEFKITGGRFSGDRIVKNDVTGFSEFDLSENQLRTITSQSDNSLELYLPESIEDLELGTSIIGASNTNISFNSITNLTVSSNLEVDEGRIEAPIQKLDVADSGVLDSGSGELYLSDLENMIVDGQLSGQQIESDSTVRTADISGDVNLDNWFSYSVNDRFNLTDTGSLTLQNSELDLSQTNNFMFEGVIDTGTGKFMPPVFTELNLKGDLTAGAIDMPQTTSLNISGDTTVNQENMSYPSLTEFYLSGNLDIGDRNLELPDATQFELDQNSDLSAGKLVIDSFNQELSLPGVVNVQNITSPSATSLDVSGDLTSSALEASQSTALNVSGQADISKASVGDLQELIVSGTLILGEIDSGMITDSFQLKDGGDIQTDADWDLSSVEDVLLEQNTKLTLEASEINSNGDLTVADGALLETPAGTDTTSKIDFDKIKVEGDVDGNFNITSNDLNITDQGSLTASGKGYGSASGPGTGGKSSGAAAGAGYGGYGGDSSLEGTGSGGSSYGDSDNPVSFGSGGASDGASGGRGGGRLVIDTGQLSVDGQLESNGLSGSASGTGDGGGGSGGTLNIQSSDIMGAGVIRSNGGSGGKGGSSGGGAGGRILLESQSQNFDGTVESRGGSGANIGSVGSVKVVDTDTDQSLRSDIGVLQGLDTLEINSGAFTGERQIYNNITDFQTIDFDENAVVGIADSGTDNSLRIDSGSQINSLEIPSTLNGDQSTSYEITGIEDLAVSGDINFQRDGDLLLPQTENITIPGRINVANLQTSQLNVFEIPSGGEVSTSNSDLDISQVTGYDISGVLNMQNAEFTAPEYRELNIPGTVDLGSEGIADISLTENLTLNDFRIGNNGDIDVSSVEELDLNGVLDLGSGTDLSIPQINRISMSDSSQIDSGASVDISNLQGEKRDFGPITVSQDFNISGLTGLEVTDDMTVNEVTDASNIDYLDVSNGNTLDFSSGTVKASQTDQIEVDGTLTGDTLETSSLQNLTVNGDVNTQNWDVQEVTESYSTSSGSTITLSGDDIDTSQVDEFTHEGDIELSGGTFDAPDYQSLGVSGLIDVGNQGTLDISTTQQLDLDGQLVTGSDADLRAGSLETLNLNGKIDTGQNTDFDAHTVSEFNSQPGSELSIGGGLDLSGLQDKLDVEGIVDVQGALNLSEIDELVINNQFTASDIDIATVRNLSVNGETSFNNDINASSIEKIDIEASNQFDLRNGEDPFVLENVQNISVGGNLLLGTDREVSFPDLQELGISGSLDITRGSLNTSQLEDLYIDTNQPLGETEWNISENLETLEITSDGKLTSDRNLSVSSNDIKISGELAARKVNLSTSKMNITDSGIIDVSARGYRRESGPGAGGRGAGKKDGGASGGGHGGWGGNVSTQGGEPYGSKKEPVTFGSGGGTGTTDNTKTNTWGGDGGGIVFVSASTIAISGDIIADGSSGRSFSGNRGAGGAGGSVWITSDSIAGNGQISASGGLGSNSGGGAGGRIAFYYNDNATDLSVNADGGSGAQNGEEGTVYWERTELCTVRGSGNECIINETRVVSPDVFEFSSVLISEQNAFLESRQGLANIIVDNSTFISGRWLGSFTFETDNPRITSGAKFEPDDGRIIIGSE